MSHWEQYEVWLENKSSWERVASFRDLDVASAVARNYSYRMRLVHAVYQGSERAHEDILAELGATREHP